MLMWNKTNLKKSLKYWLLSCLRTLQTGKQVQRGRTVTGGHDTGNKLVSGTGNEGG